MEQAAEGDIVRVRVTARLAEGAPFPLGPDVQEVIIGHGDLIPELDQALIGMNPGQTRLVILPRGKGFGHRDEERVQTVPRDLFPRNVVPKVGARVRIPSVGYEVIETTIVAVTEDSVTLDGNHPLAGQDVLVALELLEVLHF